MVKVNRRLANCSGCSKEFSGMRFSQRRGGDECLNCHFSSFGKWPKGGLNYAKKPEYLRNQENKGEHRYKTMLKQEQTSIADAQTQEVSSQINNSSNGAKPNTESDNKTQNADGN